MKIKDKVLIVEDEQSISNFISMVLNANGYDTIIVGSGEEALTMIASHCPDLIVLDLGLPDMDGMEVLKSVRKWSNLPVVVVSARNHEHDKVDALDYGADDYLVKPFEMKELMARINAVLRRSEIPDDTKKRLTFDKLVIDLDSYELLVDGKKIDTPPKELELLYHLASTPNRVYTRNQLLDEVWGFDYFGDSRTVDVHIKRLREKLERVPAEPEYIMTKWGVGYYFAGENQPTV